ncbi:hypothetical protein PORY_001041 [Pneumocystis oryctolagi]|uniref:Uncharacterized protein n=1 Tax=Pneumocystis oryctolagi TaxID=42067 RepID=A0ACB7CEK0_9ASCO|nr:hypothetical protein PORY_001041 [Pneumocystis oryctolagi]
MFNDKSDLVNVSDGNDMVISDNWEQNLEKDHVLSEKIGKMSISADAKEFCPNTEHLQQSTDSWMKYGSNNTSYGHVNKRENFQEYPASHCKFYPSENHMHITKTHSSGSPSVTKMKKSSVNENCAMSNEKVNKVNGSEKFPCVGNVLSNKDSEMVVEVDKKLHLTPEVNTLRSTLNQEKSSVFSPTDDERRCQNVADFLQEEVDDETIQDMYGKEHVNVVFIGHVDAGKSTLGGNILYMTGMVDKRTMEKYEKDAKDIGRESWYLSWALDSTKEERSKGKTVEVGRAYFETEKRRYTILDAPGHKSYVPNMIEGASQADVGVLVISARKGEYETGFEKGGQTREHAMLAKTQGITRLIVVINKMDDPTVEWSKERYAECTNKLSRFLKKELGYNPKTNFIFMPISAFTGINIKDRVDKKICPWYDGPSLLEYLDEMDTLERKVKAPLMIPIQAKYRDMGLVIEGKIESGYVKKGSSLMLMPNKNIIEVTALYDEMEEIQMARCGDQVKLRIRGVDDDDVVPGHILSSISNPVHTARVFEAQIAILEVKNLLTSGYSCIIHIHTVVQEVTFLKLLYKLDKVTNRRSKKPPPFATKGMKIVALLDVVSPICIETYDNYSQLGRFILRNEGVTVAIGKVTKLISEE